MADLRTFYDNMYSEKPLPENITPNEEIINFAKMLPKHAKVLELGCGTGEDSVRLALLRKDLEITAVDYSKAGIEKAKELAKRNSVKVDYMVADFSSPQFESNLGHYDAILCSNALQFLPKDKVYQAIEMMKRHTAPGGYNAITSFRAKDAEDKQRFISLGKYKFSEGELKSIYSGWKVKDEDYREYLVFESEGHDGLRPHSHNMVSIISRKP